jgi:hypothetical protein
LLSAFFVAIIAYGAIEILETVTEMTNTGLWDCSDTIKLLIILRWSMKPLIRLMILIPVAQVQVTDKGLLASCYQFFV